MSRLDTQTHDDVGERTTDVLAHGVAVPPYSGPHDHLTDLLLRHDWLLKRQIARHHVHRPDDILGFAAIGEHEVQRLLDDPAHAAATSADVRMIEWTLRQLQLQIDARVEQSRLHRVRLPIVELAKRFELSTREVDLLIVGLAVELDRRYERIYGFLHDDMSRRLASPGLAIGLYCDTIADQLSARALLNAHAPLRHYHLVEIADEIGSQPWLSRAMRVDERIVSFLVGEQNIDTRIARYVSWLERDAGIPDRDASGRNDREAGDRIVRLAAAQRATTKPLVYLHGGSDSGADALVQRAAAELGMPVLTVDAEQLAGSGIDVEHALFLLFREGMLSQAAIYLRNIDRALDLPFGASRHRALMRCVGEMGSVVFASGEHAWSWPLPAEPVTLDIVELAADGATEPLRAAPVSSPARRIQAKHHWPDLVLPAAQLEQLTAICSQAKHSSIVYGAWRFEGKPSLGKGLNAMFTGQPGTGKTMAAEVIAADLGVELLEIDLSQIVSKYIGETEKNLRQLFDQAETGNAVLFFDEANALLGKRSDVKDEHDRYANTEMAYLLQKMEEYSGITILATSLRQDMDAAFARRMRFIVDFPIPEEEDRLRIWRAVWPAEVPLGPDVDLSRLARQFRFAGGSIRTVALSAAFLAAEQSESVSMRHLMLAIKRELQKTGRLINEEQHRRYG